MLLNRASTNEISLSRLAIIQTNQPTNQHNTMKITTNTILHATKRLLDSVWTLAFIAHEDGTATILRYDRENGIGYDQERELPRVQLTEDADRNVTAITLDGHDVSIPVRNIEHVFAYKA